MASLKGRKVLILVPSKSLPKSVTDDISCFGCTVCSARLNDEGEKLMDKFKLDVVIISHDFGKTSGVEFLARAHSAGKALPLSVMFGPAGYLNGMEKEFTAAIGLQEFIDVDPGDRPNGTHLRKAMQSAAEKLPPIKAPQGTAEQAAPEVTQISMKPVGSSAKAETVGAV